MRKAYSNYDQNKYDSNAVYRQEVLDLKTTLDAIDDYQIDYVVVKQQFNSYNNINDYFTFTQYDQSLGN